MLNETSHEISRRIFISIQNGVCDVLTETTNETRGAQKDGHYGQENDHGVQQSGHEKLNGGK